MKRVWFRINDGEGIVPVWTSTDGKVDFKALGRHFLLNPETITLSGNVFPLDPTGKSDASWMQIKDALGVEGTEEDPVPVHGNPGIFLGCVICSLGFRGANCKLKPVATALPD
jgi:hypothetical protein